MVKEYSYISRPMVDKKPDKHSEVFDPFLVIGISILPTEHIFSSHLSGKSLAVSDII